MRLTRRSSFTRARQQTPWLRAPAPSGSTTYTEPFTGADGSGAPTGWVPYNGSAFVNSSIQGNRWRIQTSGGFEGGSMSYTAAAYTDVSFAISITHPTTLMSTYPGLGVRISGNHNGYDNTYCEGYNGYHAWVDVANNNVHLSQMTGGAYDNEIQSAPLDNAWMQPGFTLRMRLEAVGTTVRARVWDPAGAEPATWDVSTTYTAYSTGYIGFRQQPQNASDTYFDNAAWTDLSAPVSTVGRPKVWSGSAWALKPMKVWSGSAWAEKPVKFWDGFVWRSVGAPTTKILDESFNNYAVNAWTLTGAVFGVGRNGAAAQVGSTNSAVYSIPSGNQTDTLTVGFAWRYTDAFGTGQRDLMRFRSDAGATVHNTLAVIPAQNSGTTSTVGVMRGLGNGTPIATITTLPSFVQNTWYYFEVQIKLHDTTGYVIVRLNGTVIINATGLDTKNAGTAAVYDQIYVSPSVSGATGQHDDLYLRNDTAFEGDHAIGVAKILDEPFNDLTKWTYEAGTGGIVTGRNGSGFEITSGSYYYPIASVSQSPLLTVGFAVRFASLSATQLFLHFRMLGPPGSADLSLRAEIDGSLAARRGTTTVLATSSTGLITAGTWAYVEASVFHQNAGGIFTVRVNGTAVITFTGDTNNLFNDFDVYTAVALLGTVGQTVTFDDLYLRNDAIFEGDHAIP